jgi:rRNA maturation endonuclease Nob1
MMRCIWCGAKLSETDLKSYKHTKDKFCPICGNNTFDQSIFAAAVSCMFLKE